ncbi:MAG TPA: FAD:protein FMN transferase, partial [Thermoanaerobaculia bacterium]|nr:FAD:protein FMN transferase [Thermoanaerobaculia bacterium]
MGTRLALSVGGRDEVLARVGAEAAVEALEAAEGRLSTWRSDSELARLNATPVGAATEISPALAADLRGALDCSALTGGAFDPAVGALVDAWDLRGAGRVPGEAEIAAASARSRSSALELDGLRVVRRGDVRIEEGAWGKGAGLDDALVALASTPGVANAWLDLGGQAAVLGDAAWTATLADPDDRERAVAAIELRGGSLSTSGNGERRRVVAGHRIGHLLDPRSGAPARDFGSLTVWAPSALLADCLSTGLFVMGPDAALAWAAAHRDVEVLALERGEGGTLRLRASGGLSGRVRPLVAGLR